MKFYLKGLSMKTLKQNPSLIPLFAFVGVGMAMATLYPLRVLIKHPEIRVINRKETEPWNDYAEKQYKFLSPNLDYSQIKSPVPKY